MFWPQLILFGVNCMVFELFWLFNKDFKRSGHGGVLNIKLIIMTKYLSRTESFKNIY